MRCLFLSRQLHLTDENLPAYLRRLGLADPADEIQVEPAGDGNINWVRRARLPGGKSYVCKQARSALEKFPEYEVSTDRLLFEARYLERARPEDADGLLPWVWRFDPEERVLVMEDLGGATRLDVALASDRDVQAPMEAVARFLARVHRATAGDEHLPEAFQNDAMRRLHGDHIFVLPYEEAFPAPPETAARAEQVRADRELAGIARAAYDTYLRPEGVLVHADVQPGNLLLSATGPKLLDAEIAHAGDAAFDVGTLVAHLLLPAIAERRLERALPLARAVWSAYATEHGGSGRVKAEDAARYAGLELTRRTIGAARVGFVASDPAGVAVLAQGIAWTRDPAGLASRLV